MTVAVGIGTMKGAWIARSDDRLEWQLDGPYVKGWQVNTFGVAPDGTYLLTTGSTWYGAAVHRSRDLETWEQVVDGPAYAEDSGRKLEQIWTLVTSGQRMFAGVAEAGLFSSDDGGNSWNEVTGLSEHATRNAWQPGLGGLAAHRLLIDPHNPNRMWLGISAVGVFASENGGDSWELRNEGVTVAAPNDDFDIGYCVHCLVAHPDDADTIWRQDHRGVYRTTDGAKSWERIENGIPGAGFGFPIDRDSLTGRLFVVPLESDEHRLAVDGRFTIHRSDDDGESWQESVAFNDCYTGVLRDAMATDGVGGVYVGTSGGKMIYTPDAGESWVTLPWTFPRILSTQVLAV